LALSGHDYYSIPLDPRLGAERWSEHHFWILKHLLAIEAGQVYEEDAYDGKLVVRLLAGMVLLDAVRVRCKGRVPMEEMIFSRKH
jgi:hypothetical protein